MNDNYSRGGIAVLVAAVLFVPPMAHAIEQDDDGDDGPAKPVTELIITARRLDAARANVNPTLGASTYSLSNEAVESRPGGETGSINQVLLQVPGVQQDGSGQLHVRQSQGALQYRINNVIIPEGMSDLGESISARIAQKVELVTGALPAQYGFQAGGVVNVTTKNGVYLNGGQAELYGGGRGEIEPAFEYGNSLGETNVFVSGSFLRNQAGSAPLDGRAKPRHDRTDQFDGFAYFDRALNSNSRASLILGLSDDRFQDPTMHGLTAPIITPPSATYQGPLSVNGVSLYPSDQIDDSHRDATRFAVASLIHATDRYTVQASAFVRQSEASRQADGVGDLIYKGLGLSDSARDLAYGIQVEGVYEAAAAHTVRGGVVLSSNELDSAETVTVLPVDSSGRANGDAPLNLRESAHPRTGKQSAFIQDEWRVADGVTLNGGLRADAVKGKNADSAISPRLNAVWAPFDSVIFHMGYARYFLPAPIEEAAESAADLVGTTGAWPTNGSSPVKAETDDYYDVGVQGSNGGLTMGIDAYWRAAHNLIAEGQFGPAALSHTFNYADGRLRGVELSLTYAKGPLSAWGNLVFARSDGRDIVTNQTYFTPGQLADLALGWRPLAQDQRASGSAGGSYRWGKLQISGDLLYGSGLPRTLSGGTINGGRLPAYTQVNFALVYRAAEFNQRPLDLRVDVINAFDKRYALRDGTGLGDGPPQWGQGRGVYFGLEQAF